MTAETRDEYRQLFSAIFFDYFLLDELVSPEGLIAQRARDYLEQLEIDHKVTIDGDRFSTTDL